MYNGKEKDTEIEMEGGDVQMADNFDDIRQGKPSSAGLSSGFPSKNAYEDKGSASSSNMKKVFIGLTITGILILLIIIIAVAADDDGRRGRGKDLECPAYYYKVHYDEDDRDEESDDNDGDSDGDGESSDEENKCVMGKCDFRTQAMDGDGGCETCDAGMAVNGMGTKCVKNNCKQYQFLNQDDQCEECPGSFMKAGGVCVQADRSKVDLIQTYERNPDFAHYSNVHRTTQNIAMFFDRKSKNYAGPITEPYTETGLPTQSPLVSMITQSEVSPGMMYFHQIQEEPNSPYFMDVWFVNSNMTPAIVKGLRQLNNMPGKKCCWTNKDSGKSLSRYFTGFARIIEYADYQRNGASPEYAFKITEGQIKMGKPNGFARIISGFEGKQDFGFFEENARLTVDNNVADKSPQYYMDIINGWINGNDFVLFTKSYCPYSRALIDLLKAKGLERFKTFEIDKENHGNEIHKALKQKSGRMTIPNVYLKGDNLGGDEEVEAMVKDGTLKKKLQAANMYTGNL